MENYITEEMIRNLDIDLNGKDIAQVLEELNETLEERIGEQIIDALDDTQLQTLVELQESGKDDEIGTWLEATVPDFEETVQNETAILLGDFTETSDMDKTAN
jgi:hypothetical protein